MLGLRSYVQKSLKPGGEERIFFNRVGSFCKPVRNMRIMPQNKIRSRTIVDRDPGIANGTLGIREWRRKHEDTKQFVFRRGGGRHCPGVRRCADDSGGAAG